MTALILASAGGYLFAFASGVAVTLAGAFFYCTHKASIAKAAQDELEKLKAKL